MLGLGACLTGEDAHIEGSADTYTPFRVAGRCVFLSDSLDTDMTNNLLT